VKKIKVSKQVDKIKIFPVPLNLEEIKESISISNNTNSKINKGQIIKQAFFFHSQGNILEAAKYYQSFINQGFIDHRIFSNYGIILKDNGKLKEAEVYTRKAIEIQPDFADAYNNLGTILRDFNNLQEAEIYTRKAIEIQPSFAKAHFNLGTILKDLGNLQQAEIYTRKAIELNPDFAEAHLNLGNILKDLGNLQQAEIYTRKAIELNPDFAEAHLNLGNILMNLDNLQQAEIFTRKAIEIKPDFAMAHFNLGKILRDLGNLQEAELSTRKAIEIKPDCAGAYFNLATIELRQGNYKSGLENYEFRFKTKDPCRTHGKTRIKRKDNKKFEKGEKLLVVSEQGLGDTLQYMRYIPFIRKLGVDVSFSAQEKLHTLIKASGIEDNPLTPKQVNHVSEGEFIPLLSLPKYLQVNPENPIISEPYIFSTDELNKKWKNILSKENRPIIGINWQGNRNIGIVSARGRSFALETFSYLARNNDVKLLSLQKGFGSEQLDHCSFKDKFVQCQPQINSTWDFLENAAIIENCDLIITNDTSIAHLAGGMRQATWVLLKHIPEWRWGLKGESTFWYPSMRLFRQKENHNWHEVMERVSIELKEELKRYL